MTRPGIPRHFGVIPPNFEREDCVTPDCQREDLRDMFFGPDREKVFERAPREHEAREVCADCPFLVECALHGLEHEDYGVWGGLSEYDRALFGGRSGVTKRESGTHNPAKVLRDMVAAGISEERVRTILRRWKFRQRQISRERAA